MHLSASCLQGYHRLFALRLTPAFLGLIPQATPLLFFNSLCLFAQPIQLERRPKEVSKKILQSPRRKIKRLSIKVGKNTIA